MMFRFTLLAASALMLTPAASIGIAAQPNQLDFTLAAQGGRGDLTASFSKPQRRNDLWTTSFAPNRLAGLDVALFHARGSNPVRFAVNRHSGNLNCAGSGGSSFARGTCTFVPRTEFAAALAAAQVPAPRHDQWIELFALDVRQDLIASLRSAGYPAPDVDTLVELTAVGVDGDYIRALAAAGYRPERLDSLVELRAVGVTPDWIGGLARIGYARLPVDDLVELRALGVDAAFIESFRAAGYGSLSTDELVEFKALGVTAEFARRVERDLGRQPPSKLVELRALGFAFRQ